MCIVLLPPGVSPIAGINLNIKMSRTTRPATRCPILQYFNAHQRYCYYIECHSLEVQRIITFQLSVCLSVELCSPHTWYQIHDCGLNAANAKKSNCVKASPPFSPFCIPNAPKKCLPIRYLKDVSIQNMQNIPDWRCKNHKPHQWTRVKTSHVHPTWHNDSLDMLVLPSTGASHYNNCCIDGGSSPEYFGKRYVQLVCSVSPAVKACSRLTCYTT
jgi:hypothetical protein